MLLIFKERKNTQGIRLDIFLDSNLLEFYLSIAVPRESQLSATTFGIFFVPKILNLFKMTTKLHIISISDQKHKIYSFLDIFVAYLYQTHWLGKNIRQEYDPKFQRHQETSRININFWVLVGFCTT